MIPDMVNHVKSEGRVRLSLFIGAFVAVTALVLFFRVYDLLPSRELSPEHRRMTAENAIRGSLKQQILQQLQSSGSQIPREAREAFAAQQAEKLIQTDQLQFEQTVERFMSSMGEPRSRSSRRYLLESDPYHFMAQVENILETGSVSSKIEKGKFYDPLRRFPKGYWVPYGWQPYVGVFVYKVMDFFKPGIPLMEALGFVPLILVPAAVLAFYLLGASLGFGTLASSAAALTMGLSPIFLQRSSYGWFDTDPYNMLFPALILASFFSAPGSSPKKGGVLGLTAGVLTGIYVLFWVGWPFVFLLVLGGAVLLSALYFARKDPDLKSCPFFLCVYAASTVAAAITAAGLGAFLEFIFRGASYVAKFASSEPNLWPNVFFMVGETGALSFTRLVYLTGNAVTVLFALAGAASGFLMLKKSGSKLFVLKWFVLCAMSVPLLFLSLKTERFALLFVIPVALFTGMAVQVSGGFFREWLQARASSDKPAAKPMLRFFHPLWTAAVLAVLMPMQILFAHALAMKSEPIMNDTWYGGMQALRERTPENAVIYSWWPPGYFISTLARRSVFSDGGTQDLPECYWLARFFMATSEEEALGIMRMLSSSGNDALDKLKLQGVPVAEAVDLLNKILPKSRLEAAAILAGRLGEEETEEILKLTHEGDFARPTYVFLYSEMIEKNLALSVFARWNFHKAGLIKRAVSQQTGFLDFLKPGKANSVQQFLSSSDGVLKYRPESELEKQEGSILTFKNGLVVDWASKKASIQIPSEKVTGQPLSLFYLEQGELKEIKSAGSALDISALVYEADGKFYSLFADRKLILSMLYRLYYLKGAGLRFFKPFYEQSGETPRMTVQIFETDWNSFLPEAA